MEEIDGMKVVKNLAVKMEEMFRRKAEATRVGRVTEFLFIRKIHLWYNIFISICQGKGMYGIGVKSVFFLSSFFFFFAEIRFFFFNSSLLIYLT